jgi:hypothetical protein
MPLAARADRKNLGGAVGSKTCPSVDSNDEHTPSALRHSEEFCVKNPVGPPVPEVPHDCEETPKVSAPITGEEARYIFEEDGGRSVSLHKVEEGMCESTTGEFSIVVTESGSLSGNTEVLARLREAS